MARQLEALTPDEFDEWEAWRRLERDPLDLLIEVLKLGFAAICAAHGMRTKLDDFDPRPKEESATEMSPEEVATMVRGRLGSS